uniref:GGDEF domain-containing protein n=1 Tax=Magnetococcus massalia (strain MO-1) TaxID=451514 RepID=A0A1S7LG69_MAGMO|nr:Protein of unknown function. Putative diguanylate cyclase [Candidatus Magnetococcus massalia]
MQMQTPRAETSSLVPSCPFSDIPKGLGEAASVYNSLLHDPDRSSPTSRKRWAISLMLVSLLGGWGLLFGFELLPEQPVVAFVIPLVVAIIAGWSVIVNTEHNAFCSMTGTLGAMRTQRGSMFRPHQSEFLHYNDAGMLVKEHHTHAVAKHYLYHAVEDEDYLFRWMDNHNAHIFQVVGINDHRNSFSEPMQAYYFGCAVELNWTRYLLREHAEQVRKGLPIRFPLSEKGEDYIELNGDGFSFQVKEEWGQFDYIEVVASWRGERDFDIAVVDPDGGDHEAESIKDIPQKWLNFPYPAIPNELFFMKLWELRTGTKVEVHHLLPETQKTTQDPSTGLLLTPLFMDRMEQAISRHGRRDTTLVMVIVEVANIALIKHALGREAGQVVLQVVSKRIQEMMRKGDILGRLWRDEFGIVLTDFKKEFLDDIMGNIQKEFLSPISTPYGDAYPELHFGRAIYPDDGRHSHALLRHARFMAYENRIEEVLKGPLNIPAKPVMPQ